MKDRYNNIERLGVNATEYVVIKDFEWIFREQPILDMGIDAIIEECVANNPSGKFIALQIKSGQGNFNVTNNQLTYYLSHIHYNYWTNLNIPILLIAYIPESEEIFWQEINKLKIKKTNKRWKLDIPKHQIFNVKSKKSIEKIIYGFNDDDIFEFPIKELSENDISELIENVECLSKSSKSIMNIVSFIQDMREEITEINLKFKVLNERGLSDKDFEVKTLIKSVARILNLTAKRIENEVVIFSELFALGIFSLEKICIINSTIIKNDEEIKLIEERLIGLDSKTEYAIENIEYMKNSILGLPDKYIYLKESKKIMTQVIELLVQELKISQEINKKVKSNLNAL
ncbi:MAG: DUF4365 domain-containing protein [Flavobacteriales bacterium]